MPVKNNKILTGSFIFQTNRVKFNQNEVNPMCQLCWEAGETLEHFLLNCKALDTVRIPAITNIQTVLRDLLLVCPVASRFSRLQLVIDSSVIHDGQFDKTTNELYELVDTVHYYSRRLIYIYYTPNLIASWKFPLRVRNPGVYGEPHETQ